ncbi:DUF4352 domain-containing protein [Domibacillus epiphyticus]|uniref:DUF4352 domain-containing protein n=1 Tax=Domibacillus epiphyticus TaxID=1714355 RepID=A0A1V2A7X5_9BACI|nr:DUF4352 domain-containing protein [Domibacillus epiphyticus]OMP66962.1 hypothetical protein BTO28_09505 [Domibacillus epiphyticus]
MKKFFKFGCLGIIALIVLVAILAAIGGGEESTDTGADTASDKKETSAPASDEKPAEKIHGIGKAVEVGNMMFTILEKTSAAQVGPSVLPEQASGKYVVINATVKNNSNEALTLDSSFFKLKQGEKTFEADAAASMSANQNEDGSIQNSLFLEQVNPGSEVTGKVVFDVAPEIADATDLQVQVQDGMFGTNTQLINLQ